jgi:NADPH:quinone reductase-like Zn-dependent oxidoreductase
MPKDALGFEATGVVMQVGSAINHVQAGDRVFAISTGLFATRKVLPGRCVFKIPETLTFEEAATMPIVYATVIYALITLGQLRKGQVCWPVGDMKLKCTEPRLTLAYSVNPHSFWDWWCWTSSD